MIFNRPNTSEVRFLFSACSLSSNGSLGDHPSQRLDDQFSRLCSAQGRDRLTDHYLAYSVCVAMGRI